MAMILTKLILSGKWEWRSVTITTAWCNQHSGSFAHFGQGHRQAHTFKCSECTQIFTRVTDTAVRLRPALQTLLSARLKAEPPTSSLLRLYSSVLSNGQFSFTCQLLRHLKGVLLRVIGFHVLSWRNSKQTRPTKHQLCIQKSLGHVDNLIELELCQNIPKTVSSLRFVWETTKTGSQSTSFRGRELSTAHRHHTATVQTVMNSSAAIYVSSNWKFLSECRHSRLQTHFMKQMTLHGVQFRGKLGCFYDSGY